MIESIVLAAVQILKAYLTHSGEGFAKKTGEKLADKAAELYQTVRGKLSSDPYASQTLQRVEQKPEAKDRIAALQGVLEEKLTEDASFAEVIGRLVREAKVLDSHNVIASGERAIAVGGSATGVFNTGDRANINKP